MIHSIAHLDGTYQNLPMDSKHSNAYNNIAETLGICLMHLKNWYGGNFFSQCKREYSQGISHAARGVLKRLMLLNNEARLSIAAHVACTRR